MGKTMSIEMTEKAENRLASIKSRLKEREVKKINFDSLFSELIEKLSKKEEEKFIDSNTPREWKLAELMKSEEGIKEIDKIIKNRKWEQKNGQTSS
jgi:hypothetical protein